MPTNDERREVAKKLRELNVNDFGDGKFYDCAEVEITLGLLTDGGARYGVDGVRHLADLIEPGERTCRIITTVKPLSQVQELYVNSCSSCDYVFGSGERRRLPPYYGKGATSRMELPNYCPNCGAKVAEDV